MRAADFIDTLGVNTHIGSDPYNNPAQLASMLSYLGMQNIRQSSPIDAAGLANMEAIGRLGAKIDLIINGGGPVDLAGAMANVKQLAPYLNAVEGVNEAVIYPIKYKGLTGVDAAAALQKDLYAAVRSDPALSNAAVYIFTLGGIDPGAFPSLGDLSAYTDYANIHSYPPHGLRPIFVIHAAIDGGRTDAPSKPVVITETGYYTLPQNAGWGGVPESVQASYLLGLLLDEAAAGVARTYLYDLIDDGPDPQGVNREDHFGLFRFDGSPKPAATAIHNLTTLLADAKPGSRSFATEEFSYDAPGVPYNHTGNSMVFQKTDGTRIVALWNEQQLWDPDTQTATPVKHIPVTVDLRQMFGTVRVFDPTIGTDAIQTLHNVSQVTIDLTDHPLLLEILPAAGTVPPVLEPAPPIVPVPVPVPVPAPVPAPDPTAPNILVLKLSEDAWGGDAQFTVSIDGARTGGIYTATASHAAGATQTLTLNGRWGAGPHTVGVSFINDAWGGTAATDRNLYVDEVTYDGKAALGAPARLFSAGTSTFAVTGPTRPTELTLFLAEDAWRGDAQYAVSIDGRALGVSGSVTANNALGQVQSIVLQADLAAGPHDLGISFLNDAYGGTAATDRNLHVKGIAVNGERGPAGPTVLFSAETALFRVTIPTF